MSLISAPDRHISFAIDPANCPALVAELGKSGAHWTADTKQLSLYVDTPQSAIGKLGFGFGIRRRGDATLNDMRAALRRFARGLPGQNGWTTFRHALSVVAPPDARQLQRLLRADGVHQTLGSIFQIEAQRSFWSLPLGADRAHLTLEQADVTHGVKTRLARFTLTCSANLAGASFAFLAKLSQTVPLRMTGETAALEVYHAVGRREVAQPGAIVPRLTSEMSAGAAFQAIAHAAIDHFLLAEARVRAFHECEAVHQSRVALRRFSAALRLFSPVVEGDGADSVKQALRPIKNVLRTARDLDVRLGEVAALGARNPSLPTEPVSNLLTARREQAYDALVTALDAPETAALLLQLVGWIEAGDWTHDEARAKKRDMPINDFVQRRFNKLIEKFHDRCAGLERARDEERHRTRIQAKNLRYGVEFFDSLIRAARGKGVRKHQREFVSALKHLQAFLGEENDALAAQHYFANLSQNHAAKSANRTAIAAGKTLAAHINPVTYNEFGKAIRKTRRQLFDIKPFWADLAPR
jgi:triphosphatase